MSPFRFLTQVLLKMCWIKEIYQL